MLGDEIGKGAYARVYKGLDLKNGDFVAIKQVSLENVVQDDDLNTIMVCYFYLKCDHCISHLPASVLTWILVMLHVERIHQQEIDLLKVPSLALTMTLLLTGLQSWGHSVKYLWT